MSLIDELKEHKAWLESPPEINYGRTYQLAMCLGKVIELLEHGNESIKSKICDEYCRFPYVIADQEELDDICLECVLSKSDCVSWKQDAVWNAQEVKRYCSSKRLCSSECRFLIDGDEARDEYKCKLIASPENWGV